MVYQKNSKPASSNAQSPDKSASIAPQSVPLSLTPIAHFHDFTQVPVYSPVIQAKLTIGSPNDRYEQEADRVAAQVVQQLHHPASIQRSDVLDETIQAKSMLQRPDAIVSGDAPADVSTAIDRQRGGGQSLDRTLQLQMKSAFGNYFSGVRVHTDTNADSLNESLSARAFTTGQDIFFRQGEYNPGSSSGKELVAHELTHVVQQSGALQTRGIQAKLTIGQPNDRYEQEADRVAKQVMSMPEIQPAVQRVGLEEEEFQAKSLGGAIQREAVPGEEIQAKRSSEGRVEARGDFESRLSSSKSGGSPLPDNVRSFMEPRFGADFSGVRVHTGSDAVQMNREVNAQAFAHSQDVYFGAGKGPEKDALTAHELTHVVQQTGRVQRQPDIAGAVSALPPQQQTRTIEASTGSVSWIDPASPAGSGRLGVPDPSPPSNISESFITGSSGFRFSNYLHGYLTTNDSVTIASSGLRGNSGIYTSPSQFGLPSERFSTISSKINITRNGIQGVQFKQLVGARTISAGIAAGTVGIGAGAFLGAKGGAVIGALGGPIGAVGGGIIGGLLGAGAGYLAGTVTANNIPQTNFPPIWTEIRLTVMADGTRDFQMVRHSLFPSNSFYGNPIGADTLVHRNTYSARASQETAWQSSGWGGGNPWGMNRPTFTP